MGRIRNLLTITALSLTTQGMAASPPAIPDPFAFTPPAPLTVSKKTNIRVVYDVKDDVWDAGIGKALYYVRGLYQAYEAQGVPPGEMHVSVVLHSTPVYWALNEDSYRLFKNDPFDFNPNAKIIGDLIALGASIEVCNVTLRSRGWTYQDLLPGVIIVRDGYTRMIDLQQQGYAYIRF